MADLAENRNRRAKTANDRYKTNLGIPLRIAAMGYPCKAERPTERKGVVVEARRTSP